MCIFKDKFIAIIPRRRLIRDPWNTKKHFKVVCSIGEIIQKKEEYENPQGYSSHAQDTE